MAFFLFNPFWKEAFVRVFFVGAVGASVGASCWSVYFFCGPPPVPHGHGDASRGGVLQSEGLLF